MTLKTRESNITVRNMYVYKFNNGIQNGRDFSKNWGDILAPYIVERLLGEPVEVTSANCVTPKLVSVGSVFNAVRSEDLVWGTGVIRPGITGPEKPKEVFAVRGPSTRKELLKIGVSCPMIFGDPALLMPRFYNPKVQKKYKYGLIPHYVHQLNPVIEKLKGLGAKCINICQDVETFVEEIKSVEYVLSSSLHGLVAADAYGIPNARLIIDDKVYGGDFKYFDYAYSVKRGNIAGVRAKSIRNGKDLEKVLWNTQIDFDAQRLIEAFPRQQMI